MELDYKNNKVSILSEHIIKYHKTDNNNNNNNDRLTAFDPGQPG